jgi:hypothetical protein
VVAASRCDAHSGTFVAPAPGVLVVWLDNAHSKLRSKTVELAVSVGEAAP